MTNVFLNVTGIALIFEKCHRTIIRYSKKSFTTVPRTRLLIWSLQEALDIKKKPGALKALIPTRGVDITMTIQ